jgi:GNAT superfamily N-acetyltransferase
LNFEFEKKDLETISREDWDKYHIFRKIRHSETNPDDPLMSDEAAEKRILQDLENKEYYIEYFYVYRSNDNSQLIGTVSIAIFTEDSPSYKGNEHFMLFEIEILPGFRRKGLGSQILRMTVESANRLEKKLLIVTGVKDESGKQFLKKYNFTIALANRENRLKLNEVNWDMIDRWNKEGQEKNPNTKIMFFDRIPDDLIEQYAEVITKVMNQAPLGSLDISELVSTPEVLRKRENDFTSLGRTQTTVVTIEEDGSISALSEMFYSSDTKKILGQNFTGVQEQYRGRGLGKWVKAALLLYMSIRYPEATSVKTGNAESNAPMLSINNRLGFKVHKESVLAQIKVEDLIKELDNQSAMNVVI